MSGPEAIDRRSLARQQPEKRARWPRTPRRQQRVAAVLAKRQPDLTVVLENVHDPHNVSAVLRTCDAVGALRAHAVYTIEEPPPGVFARQTSASASKWVEVVRHASVAACYETLRRDGFAILATSLSTNAIGLYESDLTRPTALVLGNEMRGLSDAARALADGEIEIPMMGMVQSLNISVAGAVCLYEALRQRTAAGQYARPKLDEGTLRALEQDWLKR